MSSKSSVLLVKTDSPDTSSESLLIHFQYVHCKLYEVTILSKLQESRSIVHGTQVESTRTLDHCKLVNACQDLLNIFTAMTPETFRNCPTVTVVRTLYAIKVLWAIELNLSQNNPDFEIFSNETPFKDCLSNLSNYLGSVLLESDHRTARQILDVLQKLESSVRLIVRKRARPVRNFRFQDEGIPKTTPEDAKNDLATVTDSVIPDTPSRDQENTTHHQRLVSTNSIPTTTDDMSPIANEPFQTVGPGYLASSSLTGLPDFELMSMPDLALQQDYLRWTDDQLLADDSLYYGWFGG